MYLVANDMFQDILGEIFRQRENTHYHLRHTSQFMAHQIHSVGSDPGSYLGPKILELTPPEIKAIEYLA